jgi:hypothetical protein
MRRHDESHPQNCELLPDQQSPTPQSFTDVKPPQHDIPLRRPQNFDDWEIRRRDDDPTR